METEELIDKCRNGNETAYRHLYNAYYHKIVGICVKIVGDSMVAEELAHDAFILAFSKIDQLKDPKRFGQWLSSISSNVALRYLNRNADKRTIPFSRLQEDEVSMRTETEDDYEQWERQPSIEVIMAAIDGLPEGYRNVFRLSVIQEMSHKEIAEILGIAAHSSSSQLTRAKKLLRQLLSNYWILLMLLVLQPLTYFLLRQKEVNIHRHIVGKNNEIVQSFHVFRYL